MMSMAKKRPTSTTSQSSQIKASTSSNGNLSLQPSNMLNQKLASQLWQSLPRKRKRARKAVKKRSKSIKRLLVISHRAAINNQIVMSAGHVVIKIARIKRKSQYIAIDIGALRMAPKRTMRCSITMLPESLRRATSMMESSVTLVIQLMDKSCTMKRMRYPHPSSLISTCQSLVFRYALHTLSVASIRMSSSPSLALSRFSSLRRQKQCNTRTSNKHMPSRTLAILTDIAHKLYWRVNTMALSSMSCHNPTHCFTLMRQSTSSGTLTGTFIRIRRTSSCSCLDSLKKRRQK